MPMTWTDASLLLGRLLFGGYFLHAAYNHFRNGKMLSGYAASKGVPAPRLAIFGTGVLLAIGALSVLLGYHPLVGLGAIALFLVGVTPKMHDFWTQADPMARMGDRVNFLKNVALLGAVLALVAVPTPWAFSL